MLANVLGDAAGLGSEMDHFGDLTAGMGDVMGQFGVGKGCGTEWASVISWDCGELVQCWQSPFGCAG